MDADDVLAMAVTVGAKAMGLTECDMLKAGKFADIIMIDLNQPNMQPIHNISKNIVYSGSKANIKMTMVNGRILYENGIYHVGSDPAEIYQNANRIVEELVN